MLLAGCSGRKRDTRSKMRARSDWSTHDSRGGLAPCATVTGGPFGFVFGKCSGASCAVCRSELESAPHAAHPARCARARRRSRRPMLPPSQS